MMLCLVRQPNSVVLEVEVDPKAKGQQCLDKVCEMLGIIEVDYFGLQYVGQHGEKLWLNMRNQLRRQLSGPLPYRLQLRVKFFVPPHLLLQDITRHQFYLDVTRELIEENLRVDDQQAIRFASLIAQAELGDFSASSRATTLVCYPKWIPAFALASYRKPSQSSSCERSTWQKDETWDNSNTIADVEQTVIPRLCQAIMKEHINLSGTKPSAAEYLLLKEVSELEDFGVEQYFVRSSSGETLRVGVGPTGIVVHDKNATLRHSIPYATIHMATHAGRCFFVTYLGNNGDSQALGFKLENGQAASAIYRAVTEKHAFYSCETVRNAVTSQFIRDLKGTIASLFNENTALGKNYVFDIQRTFREVYDHTRRVIYQMESAVDRETFDCEEETSNISQGGCRMLACKDLRERLATLQDSMLCRVCMDADISTVFFPCRHVVCCSTCAPLCDSCPLCRGNVEDMQHVYLPVVGQQTVKCEDHNS